MATLPQETVRWFKSQFAESGFRGRLQLGYRKNAGVYPLFTSELAEMEAYLSQMTCHPHLDYYITANQFAGVRRHKEGLFSLHNLVIDLDSHGTFPNEWAREQLLEDFLWRFHRDTILPPPTSIVFTGRGLQFWWALEPLHQSCLYYYQQVLQQFLGEIQRILEEYPSEFEDLTLDSVASQNPAGYFRLVGSENTAVQKKVRSVIHPEKPVYLLQELEKLPYIHEKEKISVELSPEPHIPETFRPSEIFILKNVHTLAFFRAKQLLLLRQLRPKEAGEEQRNNYCFLLYNTLCPSIGHEKSMEKLRKFNQDFQIPMTEQELEQCVCSAKKRGGYRYTNQKIIEFLEISPEEQEKIQLFGVKNQKSHQVLTQLSQNPARDANRKLLKQQRNQEILRLFQEKNTQKQISEALGISHVTVSKVVQEAKIHAKKQREEQIFTLLQQGKSLRDIAKCCDVSPSTVKRHTEIFCSRCAEN